MIGISSTATWRRCASLTWLQGGIALSALLAGVLVVSAVITLWSGRVYPYVGNDSATYIETAWHFLAGDGLYAAPRLGDPANLDMSRNPLFPPGYSLLIAAVSSLGVQPSIAAIWISRIAAMVVPLALVLLFRTLVPPWVLLLLGLAVIASPGMTATEISAMSDTSFLLLVMASFGVLMGNGSKKIRFWLLSGALAGMAYWLRNVGLALLLSLPVGLATAHVVGVNRLESWRPLLAWLAAGAIFSLPMLALNYEIYGSVQPYAMGMSTIGLLENVRTFISMQVVDTAGTRLLSNAGWDWRLFVLLALPVVLATSYVAVKMWAGMESQRKLIVLALLGYVCAGAVLVIAARTRYEWGDVISERHALQYSWAVLLAGLVILYDPLVNGGVRRAALGTMLCLIALRVHDSYRTYTTHLRNHPELPLQYQPRAAALLAFVQNAAPDTLIVSNVSHWLSIETGRVVRSWNMAGLSQRAVSALGDALNASAGKRPVMLVLDPAHVSEADGRLDVFLVSLLKRGFSQIPSPLPGTLVLVRK